MNHSDSSTKWVTQIAHSMTCLFYYTNITGTIASVWNDYEWSAGYIK